jgi:hypothetical protein
MRSAHGQRGGIVMRSALIFSSMLLLSASAFAQEAVHGGDPHAGRQARRPMSEERADAAIPAGSIRVRVVDAAEQSVPNAEVVIGIMHPDGTREQKLGRTGQDGTFTLAALQTGDQRAYRVNVPFDGAKYSSSPFRLPADKGYDVTVRRLPVTTDERMVVLYVGATSIELKDDRIKVVQQSRLLNLGEQTYVFPKGGALVKLPKGYLAVQTQESMGDQRVKDDKSEGVRVEGSLPPGETTLLWGFDLPIEGDATSFEIGLPWVTFAYRVIADAPEGLALSVFDMPEPFVQRDGGRSFLITEMQRRVGDAPFRALKVSLTGIPGPGIERWLALCVALGIALGGGLIARRKPAKLDAKQAAQQAKQSIAAASPELLARARALQAERDAGEIGPEYHREQLNTLVDELAVQLYERDA